MLIGTTYGSPLLAIYIEPPADVRRVPQNYTVHCITKGLLTNILNVELNLEVHHRFIYYAKTVPGRNHHLVPMILDDNLVLYDYTAEVVWRADIVVVNGTEFSDQGLTKYNGDHDWACHVDVDSNFKDDSELQTYIRGEGGMNYLYPFVYTLILQLQASYQLT